MKKWINKLMDQFDLDFNEDKKKSHPPSLDINEDRATLLYIVDTYSKHLVDLDHHPLRKAREIFDEYVKEIIRPDRATDQKTLFRLRQYFSSYRIDEYSYFQKTFEEFRSIIWDFVDQLSEDLHIEETEEQDLKESFNELREAVECNSIDELKLQSRHFIDSYMEYQTRKGERKNQKMLKLKSSLTTVKKKLVQANKSMRLDHLTQAYNRKSFDEQIQQYWKLCQHSDNAMTLIMMDIDHFKKINDNYGHAIGDFILVECVKLLHEIFSRDVDFVARVGGEEFAVLLPEYKIDSAIKKAEAGLQRIRQEVFVQDDQQLKFTMSMGLAEYKKGESVDQWMKRADEALYEAKNTGRNKCVVATSGLKSVA